MRTLTRRSKAPKPRWRRRKNARPEEILAAALEVFTDRGFAATTLEDVAKRAGVTKGTIYLYFDSKEALFKALIREGVIDKAPTSKADLKAVQAAFNTWTTESGRSQRDVSRILSLSVGPS